MFRIILISTVFLFSSPSLPGQEFSRVYPNANGLISTLVVQDSILFTVSQDQFIDYRVIVRKMNRSGDLRDSLVLDFDPSLSLAGTGEKSLQNAGDSAILLLVSLTRANFDTVTTMLHVIDPGLQVLKTREYLYPGFAKTLAWDVLYHNDTITMIGENIRNLNSTRLSFELFITSFDTALQVLSERNYDDPYRQYLSRRVIRHGGHLYLSGVLTHNSAIPYAIPFIIKAKPNGDRLWEKRLASWYSGGGQIAFHNDTLYFCQNYTTYKTASGTVFGKPRFYKFDTAGNILKDTLYTGNDSLQQYHYNGLQVTAQGNLVLSGYFFHQGNPIGVVHIINRDLETVHFNTYRHAEQNGSFLYGVEVFSDGSILGGGMYADFLASPYSFFVWLLALDPNGCIGSYCGDNVLGAEEFSKPVLARVFPNPVEDLLTIEAPQAGDSSFGFALIDLKGRTLKEGTMETVSGRAELNVSGLPPGPYQLILKFGNHFDVHSVVKR